MCTDTAPEIIDDGNKITRKIVQISNIIRLIIFKHLVSYTQLVLSIILRILKDCLK